jgi:hypothetical protein
VIQVAGDSGDGLIRIRNGDNQYGFCPAKYLQEI